ncbi:MAG: metal ABC transporter permease [Dehalococcoidia bacterium]
MEWLTEPLAYSFMRTALLVSVLVGGTCAALGAYVVLRRMAFIGDALAHTALPGLVVAYLNGWNLFGGAIVAGLATALGIGWLSRRETLREDTAIGVLFSGMFALGILLISRTGGFRDLSHILFGNVLSVTAADLCLTAGIAVLVLAVLALLHKEMELTSVDPLHAAAIGLSPDALRYVLLALLALTVVAGIQAVGVVLISALLVIPAAAASLISTRLPRIMLIGSVVAIASAVIGLYLSYYFNVSSGAAIVLVCTGFFALAWTARTLGFTHTT